MHCKLCDSENKFDKLAEDDRGNDIVACNVCDEIQTAPEKYELVLLQEDYGRPDFNPEVSSGYFGSIAKATEMGNGLCDTDEDYWSFFVREISSGEKVR